MRAFSEFLNAKWIWAKENDRKNDWVIFVRDFNVNKLDEKVEVKIAVDSKYYLYINGEIAVFEGGLNRESLPGCGYADETDVTRFLKTGKNRIVLKCWYWGNEGRNNVDSGKAGLLFECPKLGFYSDKSWKCLRDPASQATEGEQPSYLYGGYNIGYDARKEDIRYWNAEFDISNYENVQEYGRYGDAPWGKCIKRYTSPIEFSPVQEYPSVVKGNGEAVCNLPYAMQFTPYFKVIAKGGEKIDIRSDRYYVNGGPGDENSSYRGHRVEYICKAGSNEFEALNWIVGEKVFYSIPNSVKIIRLGYRESNYGCAVLGHFFCEDAFVNRLVKKCIRTLRVCMRDNFMDCPDRERGQWIGDVSVQVPQVSYVLDKRAMLLVEKSIRDFVNLRTGDSLRGNIPGSGSIELPTQSLNALSMTGMVREYFRQTADVEILKFVFEPMVAYLKLWETNELGIVPRKAGDWWVDHLLNKDSVVLEYEWYYSALRFAAFCAKKTGIHKHDNWLRERTELIKKHFARFDTGNYYASGRVFDNNDHFKDKDRLQVVPDDRANAMAVVAGLANPDRYENIKNILMSVFNATPYMEYYVLKALFEMEYPQEAFYRMRQRYMKLVQNENTTLWEDFDILGTKNHAWSGGPLTLMFRYVAGMEYDAEKNILTIMPDLRVLHHIDCAMPINDRLVTLEADICAGEISVKLCNASNVCVRLLFDEKKSGVSSKKQFTCGEGIFEIHLPSSL